MIELQKVYTCMPTRNADKRTMRQVYRHVISSPDNSPEYKARDKVTESVEGVEPMPVGKTDRLQGQIKVGEPIAKDLVTSDFCIRLVVNAQEVFDITVNGIPEAISVVSIRKVLKAIDVA